MPYKDPEARRAYAREWQKAARKKDPEKFRERDKRYYERNAETCKARSVEWGRANPHKVREYYRKGRYGLAPEDFQNLLDSQQGVCPICGDGFDLESMEKGGRLPVVDHCHTTGEVRGILHTACNAGLGMFGDDTKRLERALEYLKRSEK